MAQGDLEVLSAGPQIMPLLNLAEVGALVALMWRIEWRSIIDVMRVGKHVRARDGSDRRAERSRAFVYTTKRYQIIVPAAILNIRRYTAINNYYYSVIAYDTCTCAPPYQSCRASAPLETLKQHHSLRP
jgi:hypothetical protein